MAKARGTVSITGELYDRLASHCKQHQISISGLVEFLVRDFFGMNDDIDPKIERYLKSAVVGDDGETLYDILVADVDQECESSPRLPDDCVIGEKLEELREEERPRREQPSVEIPSADHDPMNDLTEEEKREHDRRKQIAARSIFTF